ncbi:TRAM domain-containing protein [Paludibacterium denitrificans]|uniref:TRAM domain-containing protein n=1 Tax=Paludibacterium denitrificans TaxID=2675226 RepID=UPI001E48DEDE|nr:TRAM domain-containing protein [Paludibacterium denitrificans]
MTHTKNVALVESLDHEGRGIAHVEGKTIFIDGALPYEKVLYSAYRKKPTYENADATAVIKESFMRATPRCPHFGVCGGCSMQHVEFSAQVAIKQRVLEDNLKHLGKVSAERILTPIASTRPRNYRHRARLSVRLVEKKGGVLVGFHEKRSSYIVDMRECHILLSAYFRPDRADARDDHPSVHPQPPATSGSGRGRQAGHTGVPQHGPDHR